MNKSAAGEGHAPLHAKGEAWMPFGGGGGPADYVNDPGSDEDALDWSEDDEY